MAEPGERVDEAARREVFEETGLDVSTDRLVAVIDRDGILILVYEGDVLGGQETPQAEEIAELRWFSADELADANAFDLVVQLGVSTHERGLVPVSVMFPDAVRPGFAAVAVQ